MRRMISGKAQKYIKDLATNHPDPSAEGGGSSYTAGTGIDISEGEISIDNTVATKTFVENYAEPAGYLFELTGENGQLTQQQIQKLQSLGRDALGKKILLFDGSGTYLEFIIDWIQDHTRPNQYIYVAHNAQGIGYSNTATWYGFSVYNVLSINWDFRREYTWQCGNQDFNLPLSSTDFVRDPDTYEICISNTIARVNDIPAQVQANWNESDTTSKAYIQNKPTIPTTATSTSSVTPNTVQLTFTYSDNTTENITLMTGASVTTTTTLS